LFATNVTGAMLMAREAAAFRQEAARKTWNIAVHRPLCAGPQRHAYYASKSRCVACGVLASGTPEIQYRVFLVNQASRYELLSDCRIATEGERKQAARRRHAYMVKAMLEMEDRGLRRVVPSSPRILRIDAAAELPVRAGSARNKSERLPAQKPGGRYKSNSRAQGGFIAGMFPFLTRAGPLELQVRYKISPKTGNSKLDYYKG